MKLKHKVSLLSAAMPHIHWQTGLLAKTTVKESESTDHDGSFASQENFEITITLAVIVRWR